MNGNAKYEIQEIYRHLDLALIFVTEKKCRAHIDEAIEAGIRLDKILYGKSKREASDMS